MKCRNCRSSLKFTLIDLGYSPPSNAYLKETGLNQLEVHYPLKVLVCTECWLVQTEDYTNADLLFNSEYAYFSSTSSIWTLHAKQFCETVSKELQLNCSSFVIEIASNDGYLLKNFIAAGIPCLGIEPTESTALVAEALGVPVLREFFGEQIGKRLALAGKLADLIIGNNVYAHVPDINDFTCGLKTVLKPGGTITLEFPHVLKLIEDCQFDTIYHEHFSYLSLRTVKRLFEKSGLRIWRVDKLTTHGGSLRVYGCHDDDSRETQPSVGEVLQLEKDHDLEVIGTYMDFQERATKIKDDLILFLIQQKRAGKKVVGYGAAAKGNTLLNYAGVKSDLLPCICDSAVAKQGKFTPGGHIPIISPNHLSRLRPDYLLVLPWNIVGEVKAELSFLKETGTRFVTAVPELTVQ